MDTLDPDEGDAENPQERPADEMVRDLLRIIAPGALSTGRFVIVIDSIDAETGERPDPVFVVPTEQAEWETRGLIDWSISRLDSIYVGVCDCDDDDGE